MKFNVDLPDDMKEYLESGEYSYEKDIQPILNAVCGNPGLEDLQKAFHKVTCELNERITACFEQEITVEIVLYLGLTVYYSGTYGNGVMINGVYVAGMTPEEVNTVLLEQTDAASFTVTDKYGEN